MLSDMGLNKHWDYMTWSMAQIPEAAKTVHDHPGLGKR